MRRGMAGLSVTPKSVRVTFVSVGSSPSRGKKLIRAPREYPPFRESWGRDSVLKKNPLRLPAKSGLW